MGTLEDFVSVSITTISQTPTQVGFGTPLLAAYHTLDPVQRVRTYNKMADAVADGIAATGKTAGAYKALSVMFAQSPRPKQIKLGRLSAAHTQITDLVVTSATEGVVYKFDFGKLGGAMRTYVRTVPASSSIGAECTAIAALIAADWPTGAAATISAFSTPKQTLTGLTGMTADMVGEWMTISGCATSGNNGTFQITDFISATSVKISNAAGAGTDANNASISWVVGVVLTTPGSTKVTITAVEPAEMFDVQNWTNNFELTDATALDSSLVTDLGAIIAEDNNWYGLALVHNNKADVAAAGPWAETNKKLFFYNSSDWGCGDAATTTDVFSTLKALTLFRSVGLYNGTELLNYGGAGWLAEGLPWAPGSSTFAFKTPRTVPVDSAVSSTQEGIILGKHANTFTEVAGFNITNPGKSAAGEYVDIAFGRDWLEARLKERVFGLLVSVRKVPYTDTGVDLVTSGVHAQLQDGVTSTFLAADPAPTVVAPKVKDVSTADRANRLLPDVSFSAHIAGAIQAVEIVGTISV